MVNLNRIVLLVVQLGQQQKLLNEVKTLCLAEHRLAAQQASMLPSMQEGQIVEAGEGASAACRSAE